MSEEKGKMKFGPKALVLMLALASVSFAAVVVFISNSVAGSATVQSPFAVVITGTTVGTLVNETYVDFGTITGGSDFQVTIVPENRANKALNGYFEVSFDSTDGLMDTGSFTTVRINGVPAGYFCNANQKAYYYISSVAETFPIGVLPAKTVYAELNLGYVGDLTMESQLVINRAC